MGKPVSQRVSKGLETAPDGRPRPVGYNPGALALLVLAPAYLAYQAFQTPTTVVYRVPVWGWVHWGEWDYSVFLKPNTLYDARELGPGLTYYETLVEGIEARFSYNMTTDAPARIEGWYEITADLAAGELLRERVLVVPRTTFEVTEGSSVSVEQVLPIDREAYRARLEQMAEETGLQAGEDPTVTYTAHVEAEAVAGTGSTRQVLEPNLVVPLTGATFTIEGDRSLKANGVIRRTETSPASGVQLRHRYFLAATGILAIIPPIFALVTAARPRRPDPLAREAGRIRRRYRKRIAEAGPGEPQLPGGEVVSVASMRDLARISEELLKPIIYRGPSDQEDQHVFYTVDGATRYQYTLAAPGGEVVSVDSIEELDRISQRLHKPIIYSGGPDQHVFYTVDGATRYQHVLPGRNPP